MNVNDKNDRSDPISSNREAPLEVRVAVLEDSIVKLNHELHELLQVIKDGLTDAH